MFGALLLKMPLAPFVYRLGSVLGWTLGKLTLRQVLSNFLPHSTKNQKEKFEVKLLVDRYLLNFLPKEYGIIPPTHETLSHIDSIICKDQYGTEEFLKPGSIIFDAGANVGIFSMHAAALDAQNKIYAFEPVRRTHDILKQNTASYQNVLPFQKALGNSAGKTFIRTSHLYSSASRIEDEKIDAEWLPTKERFDDHEEIEMTTIDSVMKEQNISRLDFLKIDTEGYERAVLEGAKETIRTYMPVIALSAYHRQNDKKEIPELILSICPNYTYKIIKKLEEDFIFWVREEEKKSPASS